MRYIRYAFYAALAVILVTLALGNRQMVVLNTLPEGLRGFPGAGLVDFSIELPLFLVIFIGILMGLVIGYVAEYLREHKHRVEAARKGGEVRKLERELKKTQAERDKDKDEVLALLDQAS